MGGFSDYKDQCYFTSKRKYNRQVDPLLIKKEVKLLRKYIEKYNISLVGASRNIPSENIRNHLLNIARFVVSTDDILNKFKSTKVLPKVDIGVTTNLKLKLIEEYMDHLRLYIILFMDDEFKEIIKYLNIRFNDDTKSKAKLRTVVDNSNNNGVFKGIAIEISNMGKSIYILTRQGLLVNVKYTKCKIGDDILSQKYKLISNTTKVIFGTFITLGIIACVLLGIYNKEKHDIVIKTTSEISLEINSFSKVVYTASPTEKGKELLEKENIKHDSLDDALLKVLKYADKNGMIPDNSIINIAVTGDDFNLGQIPKTAKYVESQYSDNLKKGNYFRLVINNNGTQEIIRPVKN
ncbi:MAG: anti-sigma-I factor RsgI family protein [Sarcina sp.]